MPDNRLRSLCGNEPLLIPRRVIATTLAIAFMTTPAFGQDSVNSDNGDAPSRTGSRLAVNPDLAVATPVLGISGDEARVRGNIRAEDFINILPLVFAGQASEISANATGTGTLNLRGLGAERTLVLMDGRRLPYGASNAAAANLDAIPLPMVERVDLLTGGASAVYGSDAVGGVANFVLKRDFEGITFGGQWGTSRNSNDDGFFTNVLEAGQQPVPGSSSDGTEGLIYALLGISTPNDRGNIMLYAAYEDREEIVQADRIFSGCVLGQDQGPLSFGGLGCIGSANFRLFGGPGGFAFQRENGDIDNFFNASGPERSFNFGRANFFQRPSERYNLHVKGYYELSQKVEAFTDISYFNNRSDSQTAPTASFGIGTYSINCDHPLIQTNTGTESLLDLFGCTPADVATGAVLDGITASHRNVEGGERTTRFDNSAWRALAGLRGTIADHWNWEAFAQLSDTEDEQRSTNDFLRTNLQQALLATTDANGNVVCTDPSGGCVPYNIFQRGPNGESLVTQQALDFIQGVALVTGSTQQTVLGANVQASLEDYGLRLPTANEGIAVSFGVEWRTDELDRTPDSLSRSPDSFTGVGEATLPVSGELETRDFYSEVEIPLLSDKPFAEQLTLRAQYRFSDYTATGSNASNDFDASSYGVSLAWAPVSQLRLRGQFQRAVRAPNVIELFTAGGTEAGSLGAFIGPNLWDPCATANPILTLEQCARTGVTAAQYGSIPDATAGVVDVITGGNAQLSTENADTITIGATWTPSFLENLTLSVDYFDIAVEDVISQAPPVATILNQCLLTGDPMFCDLIARGASGSLAAGTPGSGFTQTNLNIAALDTSGIDIQAVYGFDIGNHAISIDYAATVLETLARTDISGFASSDSAGLFDRDGGAPTPEYRHRLVTTWQTPWNIDFIGTWRHFGETENRDLDDFEPALDSVNYLDLAANWRVSDGLTLRASALNILAEDPPVFTGAGADLGSGNTYPTIFDISTVFVASFEYSF